MQAVQAIAGNAGNPTIADHADNAAKQCTITERESLSPSMTADCCQVHSACRMSVESLLCQPARRRQGTSSPCGLAGRLSADLATKEPRPQLAIALHAKPWPTRRLLHQGTDCASIPCESASADMVQGLCQLAIHSFSQMALKSSLGVCVVCNAGRLGAGGNRVATRIPNGPLPRHWQHAPLLCCVRVCTVTPALFA